VFFYRGAGKVLIMNSESVSAITQASAGGVLPASRTRSLRAQVALAFFAIYIIWGSTYLAIRYAVETIPPLYTAGFRHLVAGSILLLWCAWKKLRPTRAQLRASVIIGALFFLGGHGALHWAEQRINSGLASLLIATEPIFVFVLAAAAEKRWRMNARLLAGIVLGLGGVALLFGKNSLMAGPRMVTAAVVTLLGALSWAVGIVYSRRSHLSGHPLLLSAFSLISGAVLLLVAGTAAGEGRVFRFAAVSDRSWMALGYLILFGSVIAFTAYNWLLEHYSPTLVATHTYVNPIVAVLLGWLLANEAVTLNVAMAGAMVIGAVVLVDRGMARLQRA
jgi:drug/metabolite transporter (DMT)-like permease